MQRIIDRIHTRRAKPRGKGGYSRAPRRMRGMRPRIRGVRRDKEGRDGGIAVLPEPSRDVMARLSKAARDDVARERRPFWKRLPLSPILIPALTTAVALMVWFYYGQGGGGYMDTMSRDVMARKMKAQDSSMETAGQAAPEMKREYPVEAESSPAMSERGAADEVMPAAPAPPQAGAVFPFRRSAGRVRRERKEIRTLRKKRSPKRRPKNPHPHGL